MNKSFEFFFDLASPWTCLAFHNVQPLAAEAGSTIICRPFLVGGVHNQVNEAYVASRAHHQGSLKWWQLVQSLRDWAAQSGVPMHFPSRLFAPRSAHAMRFCCALEDRQNDLLQFAKPALMRTTPIN